MFCALSQVQFYLKPLRSNLEQAAHQHLLSVGKATGNHLSHFISWWRKAEGPAFGQTNHHHPATKGATGLTLGHRKFRVGFDEAFIVQRGHCALR